MRISKRLILLVAVAAALAPAPARAQVLGNFQWAGVGNSFGWYYKKLDNSVIGVYGGAAYQAQFKWDAPAPLYMPLHGNSATGFGPAQDIYCVDFNHHAQSAYPAYFTKLNEAPLTKTRSSDLSMYLKAAWLITKMDATAINTTAGQQQRADIHAAIWYLMSADPLHPSTTGDPRFVLHGSTWDNTGLNSWVAQANANWTSVNAQDWTVVTDQCVSLTGHAGQGFNSVDTCSQEFLTRNVTPEPATMILLGTGLLATLAMTGVLRRQSV